MDPRELIASLCGVAQRGVATDAERRAALLLRDELRSHGRRAVLDVHWVRPYEEWSLAVHGLGGVAASIVSVYTAPFGLALAAFLALSWLVAGGLPATLAFPRRATQHVWSPPRREPGPDDVLLVITAGYAARRTGAGYAPVLRRLGARLQRLVAARAPGPALWVGLALLLLAGAAGARLGDHDSLLLGMAQLLPTLYLLLAGAAGLDAALSRFGPGAGEAAAVAVALALVDALDRKPPRRLVPSLLLAGGGEAALRAHLKRFQRRPRTTVVLELAAGSRGTPHAFVRAGAPLALATHPQLRAAVQRVEAPSAVAHRRTLASVARGARLPALAIGPLEPPGITPGFRSARDDDADLETVRATARLALRVVRALDAELGPDQASKRATSSPTRGRGSDSSHATPASSPS